MYVCVRVRVSEYVCVRVGVLVHVLQKCTYHPTSQWLAPAAAGATLAWHTRSHSHSSPFSLCWGPKGAPVGCVGVGVGVGVCVQVCVPVMFNISIIEHLYNCLRDVWKNARWIDWVICV